MAKFGREAKIFSCFPFKFEVLVKYSSEIGKNGSSEEKSAEDIIEVSRMDTISYKKVSKSRRENSLQ